MKKILFAFAFLFVTATITAQTEEELKATLATKKDSIAAIQGRADAIQAQIDGLPGWRTGAFGTIGGSLSNFSNWYAQGVPNNSSGNIGVTANVFANLQQEKFFWRNSLTANFAWVKLDDKDIDTDEEGFTGTTDVFNISSLYGRKLSEKWAVSGLMEYRTTVLNNFNDPGYLDLGVGATWTPVQNLVVVIHPLNYNFVFADNDAVFQSSLGAKIVADYTRQIGAVGFKSNLSMFQSYESGDLSNWQWTNTFTYTLWKMIGVGFDFGLRNNAQEALNYELTTLGNTGATFDNIDNDLQSFWNIGLSYAF
ncbi:MULTISPECIES: DUF3078 domain-containing protein [Croceitalea]|uniref:DUF3078 domain-containing protein n=1 Tax=Croceitalea vernalis TaxID=3075599 RepID=A0ABU3BEK8_9FLAO|nr:MULTISPECIES: DUF3078 domain-containing protein [unclassified Croceitalea]MDT0538816.1 DUF3078 domain-containing protein [Croceitalea sp. P059]MDT0620599.1 DUF3078 domain-containing protein [Croceitalea sp. P007]